MFSARVTQLKLLAILLTGCIPPAPIPVIDFEFQGPGGRPVYRSTSLAALERDFGAGIQPVVVLLETPSLADLRYRHQVAAVESPNAEALQLLVVASCTCGIDPSGYSTTAETAPMIAAAA